MTLNEYIESLQQFIKTHPEAGEYLAVYSEDDEGNSFSPVHYTPSTGAYDREEREFKLSHFPEGDSEEYAVCIN